LKQEDKALDGAGFVLSPHTRRVKITETYAKLALWIAAGITMGTLFVIIGYILFRGFVSDLRIQYEVLPEGIKVIANEESADQGILVIVNDGIRIQDITITEVADLFSGELDNWGAISEQDIDVRVFAQNGSIRGLFERAAFLDTPQFSKDTVFSDGDREIIERVSNTSGGIGFISEASADYLNGKDAKPVEIRRISIAVNSDVLRTSDGMRIRYLTGEQTKSIFLGTYNNWSQLGGADLPIPIAVFNENSLIRREFQEMLLGSDNRIRDTAKVVDSPYELAQFLAQNPGGIGFVYYNDALTHDLELVNIERRETQLNLDFAFITEAPRRAGRVGGISTIILNTFYMIFLTLILAGPIGVAAAVYLTEYARQSRINEILRFGTETLAGVPSIIFGLFGFILFVMYLDIGVGLLSGTLTITFMILPTIIRASEEAIKSVPQAMRESSLALGATKWQTVTRVVVPAAIPGIMTGLILAIGRAVGETAALLFTMGSDYRLARDFLSSARVMSVHLYILVREGISFERAFATGTILIIVILLINFATNKLIGRMVRMHG
jgi:phosphate transport system permease protein